jgi:hypothetical protein
MFPIVLTHRDAKCVPKWQIGGALLMGWGKGVSGYGTESLTLYHSG